MVLGNSIIVVEHILKFIEIVLKFENRFEMSEFYQPQTFTKAEKWRNILQKMKNDRFPAQTSLKIMPELILNVIVNNAYTCCVKYAHIYTVQHI